jgi:hypothetical protein
MFAWRRLLSSVFVLMVATAMMASVSSQAVADETGLVDPASGNWYLYDDAGALTTSFFFGDPGDYPFVGDWDGDGIETPGLYRQADGYVYLRNSNTQGNADIRFFFGDPGDVPIAGDFDNDGFDTVSIYRPSNQTFYIINKLGAGDGGLGAADTSYVFGDPGDKPFVGDFDGDGVETVGLHREPTGLVYFRNSHTQGNADSQFIFGDPGDRLIAGDWNDDGMFSPALFRPSDTTMYFRYTNTQGNADAQFIVGSGSWLPVGGDWTPAAPPPPPPPPPPAVLAVASIKVEPVVGFAIPGIIVGTRELIAEFVDVDGDGAPSVGDVIRTDKYPKDFGTSNLGQFQVTEHVITTLDTFTHTAELLSVVINGGTNFTWTHTTTGEAWYEDGAGGGSEFSDSFETGATETVGTQAGSPSSPAEPVIRATRVSDPADNSWINVVITPPTP